MTSRGDAQRSGAIRTDAYLSVESIAKPGFGLEWKRKLENAPRQSVSLTQGVGGNGSTLNPAPVILAGSGNHVYGVEVDTGGLSWSRHFGDVAASRATAACPGGMTASVTRSTNVTQPAAGANPARGGGRGPYLSGVGKPGEGVPDELMQGGMGGPGSPARGGGGFGGPGGPAGPGPGGPPGAGPGGARGGQPGPGPFFGAGRGPQTVYAIASDGVLHTLGAMEGKDVKKPIAFMPPNANVSDTIAIGDTLYAATSNGCSGVPDGVWAIDLSAPDPKAISWKSTGSPAGMAFDSKGTLFVTAADNLFALDPKTLEPRDSFSMPGASFTTPPVVFAYQDQELIAAATKDGRIVLLNAASLGGADHKTPLPTSAPTTKSAAWSPSALATWEDAAKTRFLLIPAVAAKGSIIAYKVAGTPLAPKLEQVWTAGDLGTPSAPIVVNGVVFALKTGSPSAPAVLYAFDGLSGNAIWNSGKSIASYVRSTDLWSSSAQVYVATHDATIYAFGFAMDRHL
jgi:hypothetical protein